MVATMEARRARRGRNGRHAHSDGDPAAAAARTFGRKCTARGKVPTGKEGEALRRYAIDLEIAGYNSEEILKFLATANERCERPVNDIVGIVADGLRVAHAQDDEQPGKVATSDIAEWLIDEKGLRFAKDAADVLYIFEDGTWKPTARKRIEEFGKAFYLLKGVQRKFTRYRLDEVAFYIRCDCPELWERPPEDRISVLNGILDLETRTLGEHSDAFLSPVQIPVRYDPDARCPAWEKFIGEVFPQDAAPLAWEVPAALMVPGLGQEKAILLLGQAGTGKSRYLAGLKAFLGKRNVGTEPLQRLEHRTWGSARLAGKLANICADLPRNDIRTCSVFLQTTGLDMLTAEEKYKTPYDLEPFTRLIFSSNNPPRARDAGEAFFDRWLVVPFSNRFRGTRQEIPAKELDAVLGSPAELSGFLNRALDALPDVQRHGFTQSASMKAAHREFEELTDPVLAWLNAKVVEASSAFVSKAELLGAYNRDAERTGRPTETPHAFGRAVKRWRPEIDEAKRTIADERAKVWLGIGLADRERQE